EKLAQELGTETLALRADLTREDQVRELFKNAVLRFGRLDGVVANAGIWPAEPAPLHKMPLSRWNRVIATDQTSVFLTCREFLAHLEQRPRQEAGVVLVGSTAAVFGEAGHAAYAAAKAAVTYGLTRTLKNEITELAPLGRVNAVCPGWTRTAMARHEMENREAVARVLQTRAIRRIARPQEIAAAIVFLLSPRLAGHITGEILTAAGGMEGRILHAPDAVDPTMA
ncbi:MAG: SDR family NAD(P)-dependent oxidoreductase, partial [Acidobacteriota bacterium]